MNNTISSTIMTTPDVLVVGGGVAGVAAALAAASTGASVVLLEKNATLGGKATAAYVGTICGLYYRSEASESRYVMNGFPRYFAEKLQASSQSKPVFYRNGLHFLPYDHFAFIRLCDDLIQQSDINVYLHAQLIHITKEDDHIRQATVIIDNRPFTFQPKMVIDTTGESTVSNFAALDTLQSETYQAAAQIFTLTGIATDDEQTLQLSLLHVIQKGIETGFYSKNNEMLSIVPGSLKSGSAIFKLGLHMEIDHNPARITLLEVSARKAVSEIVQYLTSHHAFFRNASLAMVAPEVGIRTGPRSRGKVILQKEDILECRKVNDSVARGAWPIEFWEPGKKLRMEYFPLDDYYDIPGTALQSATVSNLFFAGRNLSASDEAIASARVIGTCLATGHAAGCLAAGSIQKESYEATIKTIQQSFLAK